jgi:hypothetical protein
VQEIEIISLSQERMLDWRVLGKVAVEEQSVCEQKWSPEALSPSPPGFPLRPLAYVLTGATELNSLTFNKA